MTESLPHACQDVIRAYFGLDFGGGRTVACPYVQNTPPRKRFGAAVEVGKGSPGEIIAEVTARATIHWSGFGEASANEIRAFMVKERIGIDCSGFTVRVLRPLLHEKTGASMSHIFYPVKTLWLRKILFQLRPFHNIDVMTLTSPMNAVAIDLSVLKPADVIRTRGGKHVLLVSEVNRNDDGALRSFTYVHSSEAFGVDSGVRTGVVAITNAQEDLAQQEWQEMWQGRCPTREGWMERKERNGIFRLRALS